MRFDPQTHAVRGDLADVRLAAQVFAPHYAAPIACVAGKPVGVFAARDGGERLAELAPGDPFELLELAGVHGWGIATAAGRVGYVDRAALELA